MAEEDTVVDDQGQSSDTNTETENTDTETATDTSSDNKNTENDTTDELDLESLEPEVRTTEEIADDKNKKGAEESDDTVDDEDLKVIDRQIDKRLSPLEASIQKQNDKIEVNTYLQANPELSKYKPAILKYVSHPAYKNVPVSAIAAIVSSKDQQRIGAAKERDAAKKAKETRSGGSQARSNDSSGGKDVWAMSKADFEAHIANGIAAAANKK